MERMPCGQIKADAAFFRIGSIAHNLFVLFRHSALDADWQRQKVASLRWRLFHLPGKVVRHAGAWVLKIAAAALDLFRPIRAKSFSLALTWSLGALPYRQFLRPKCPPSDRKNVNRGIWIPQSLEDASFFPLEKAGVDCACTAKAFRRQCFPLRTCSQYVHDCLKNKSRDFGLSLTTSLTDIKPICRTLPYRDQWLHAHLQLIGDLS